MKIGSDGASLTLIEVRHKEGANYFEGRSKKPEVIGNVIVLGFQINIINTIMYSNLNYSYSLSQMR